MLENKVLAINGHTVESHNHSTNKLPRTSSGASIPKIGNMKAAVQPSIELEPLNSARSSGSLFSIHSQSTQNFQNHRDREKAALQKEAHLATLQKIETQSTAYRKELEEQLGDTLYKRAQAKLMIEADPANIEAALSDVLKVYLHSSMKLFLLVSTSFEIILFV